MEYTVDQMLSILSAISVIGITDDGSNFLSLYLF